MMKICLRARKFLFVLVLLNLYFYSTAQSFIRPAFFVENTIKTSAGENPPYFSVANHHGIFSAEKNAILARTGLQQHFDTSKNLSLGYDLDLIYRYDSQHRFWVQQANARIKIYFIVLQGGTAETTYGNQDELLSSGAYLFSGNARPIPELKISTQDYVVVPFTKNLLEFKGGMAHGWFGNEDQYVTGAYLHHKYAYIRIGERKFRFSVSLGLHHAAMWGGKSPNNGRLPDDWSAFGSVILGKMGNSSGPVNEQINAIGNHLASYSIGIDYKMDQQKLHFYWQTMLEDKNGRVGLDWKNKGDGLWGISLHRPIIAKGIQRVMLEFFNSTSQSGDTARSGNDNYFNNYLYQSGWTYHRMTIGTPLITSPIFTNRTPEMWNFLDNNSIRALIGGMIYKIDEKTITVRMAFTKNFGSKNKPYTPPKHQVYTAIEYDYPSSRFENLLFSWQAAFDMGSHLGNNAGLMVKIRKNF